MISAKLIKDSISEKGDRITTWELEYPRFINSELMTHRLFSRNSASSRAIPLKKMIESVWKNPAHPIHWGKNQSGMQADEVFTGTTLDLVKHTWFTAGKTVCGFAKIMDKLKVHKQIANRILEPWSHIKVVVTSTEMDNFFTLRNHKDAQPEFQELAKQMWKLFNESKPNLLKFGEWHLPYVDDNNIKLEDAIKLSSSLCAQVSYRKLDDSLEKAIKIYDRLVDSKPPHLSPFEHQATPMDESSNLFTNGVTHHDCLNRFWSGNFCGWIQNRQLMTHELRTEPMTSKHL